MKAVAVLLGLGIVGGLAFWLLRSSTPTNRAGASNAQDSKATGPVASLNPTAPSRPMAAPMLPEEAVREEFGQKRLPFYRFLRERYSPTVERFAVTEQLDTLDLQVTRADNETLQFLLSNAITPTARQYGFRKVRFYVANPPGSVQPNTLVAESADDGAGHWNTFRK